LDRLLPNVNVVPSHFWYPLGIPCLQVDPTAARKKGDLLLYSGDLFPTEPCKPPSCPLVKPKMDLYCRGFFLSETSHRLSSSWLVLPSISSSYHTRRSACSKIGPCGCPRSSNKTFLLPLLLKEGYVWFRGRSLLLHGIGGSRLRPILDRSGGSAGAGRLMLILVYNSF